jgi:hypothetical protein
MHILRIHEHGPQRPNRSVRQLAEHLKLDFAPANLPLSMVALARRFEELEFRVALLEHELRRPLWRRVLAKVGGGAK